MKTQKAPNPPRRKSGTVKALADALGLTTRQISTLLAEGCPENPTDALTWYGLKNAASNDDDSPAALRRRRIKYLDSQNQLLQSQLAERERRLIPVEDVRETALRCYSVSKARFLRLSHELPSRISGLDESRCYKIIYDAVVEVLTELSDDSLKLFENHEKTK